MFEQVAKIKWLVRSVVVLLAILVVSQIVMAIKISNIGSRVEVFVLAREMESVQKDIDALKKSNKELQQSLGEYKKAMDTIGQQLPVMIGAHNKMVEGSQAIMMQQGREIMVVARALSDDYGQKKWLKMIGKSRQELEDEAKKAEADAIKAAQAAQAAQAASKPVEKK